MPVDEYGGDGIAGGCEEGVLQEAGVGEGVEKGRELADLEIGEREAMLEEGIRERADDHIFSIVIEDAEQREKAAIVTIGMGDGDIA